MPEAKPEVNVYPEFELALTAVYLLQPDKQGNVHPGQLPQTGHSAARSELIIHRLPCINSVLLALRRVPR